MHKSSSDILLSGLIQYTDEIIEDHRCGFQHDKLTTLEYSFGLLRCVVFWFYSNVSEDHAASIFTVVTLDLQSDYLSRHWL